MWSNSSGARLRHTHSLTHSDSGTDRATLKVCHTRRPTPPSFSHPSLRSSSDSWTVPLAVMDIQFEPPPQLLQTPLAPKADREAELLRRQILREERRQNRLATIEKWQPTVDKEKRDCERWLQQGKSNGVTQTDDIKRSQQELLGRQIRMTWEVSPASQRPYPSCSASSDVFVLPFSLSYSRPHALRKSSGGVAIASSEISRHSSTNIGQVADFKWPPLAPRSPECTMPFQTSTWSSSTLHDLSEWVSLPIQSREGSIQELRWRMSSQSGTTSGPLQSS